MKIRLFLLFISITSLLSSLNAGLRDTLDLSGIWQYRLSGVPVELPGEGNILFPGTLDNEHKSLYNPETDNTTQLRREYSYIGSANYSRKIEIPENWKGKDIYLFIERTKPSTIKIDGKVAGYNSRISSPQKYKLTEYLKPGKHLLEIEVNNADSIPPIVARSSNAVSEATQTNWNGILGQFLLEARNHFSIDKILIDDHNIPEKFSVAIDFSERAPSNLTLIAKIDGVPALSQNIKTGSASMNIEIPAHKDLLWSAINPHKTDLVFEIKDNNGKILDEYKVTTGFRNFSTTEDYFTINGNPIFLRGTVNSAVFPLTAHTPLDLQSWIDYFSILKEYGINHVRFHSWTPPDAAFQAADQIGIYILTELPIWGELDRDLKFHNKFLNEELIGIMEAYSHHPSFVLFSTGNELWGDISLMSEYKNAAKFLNPRILSTHGSNIYLGMNGQISDEDFIVTSKIGDDVNKSVRGSVSFADSSSGGHFNSTYPNSNFNFAEATKSVTVPIISHEVGQYQSYPDFNEIEKYSGHLKADNLKEFKNRAIEAGTYRKSQQFKEASGKWASKLYKAELELAQRSPGIGGIELMGLEDYPGQGTAIIGILNPFMESKGFITPRDWRKSSDDVALLAEFPKFTFFEDEFVEIPVLSVNFSDNPEAITNVNWSTDFSTGTINTLPGNGVIENEAILLKMPKVNEPKKMSLSLKAKGNISNDYDFWVFPKKTPKVKNVTITDNLTEALILLDQGERVILCPDSVTDANATLDPLFTNDFWNYRMYRSICDEMNLTPSPGTLGLFIKSDHPALAKFPSDEHTDWHWYSIITNSRPLIYDRLPKDFDPIIEVIDNVERNFRLSLLLECNMGKGKLIILSADKDEISKYPEGKWLLQSIKEYAASKDFKPNITLTPDQLVNLVTKPSRARLIKELKNETYNSHWD
ncbi:MAG: beta-glycosidase [Muribaculaceae bacterium]|nr:beta-glycosidase [Muribaculaceae bacterium]